MRREVEAEEDLLHHCVNIWQTHALTGTVSVSHLVISLHCKLVFSQWQTTTDGR